MGVRWVFTNIPEILLHDIQLIGNEYGLAPPGLPIGVVVVVVSTLVVVGCDDTGVVVARLDVGRM